MKKENPVSCAVKHTALYIILVGVFLILLGVAIVFYPQIITLFVVGFFVTTGVTSLLFGLKIFSLYKKTLDIFKKFNLE